MTEDQPVSERAIQIGAELIIHQHLESGWCKKCQDPAHPNRRLTTDEILGCDLFNWALQKRLEK